MPKPKAHINPEMLSWARKTVKLSVELAAGKIGIKPEKLELWEKGEDFPTIKQLYKIAQVYRRPFALFYFPEPPKHFKPIKDFRKFTQIDPLSEQEEYVLQKELLLFRQKREIALDLNEQLNSETPTFSLTETVHQSSSELAGKIAAYLEIDYAQVQALKPGYDALNFWKETLESKGILVFQSTGAPLHIMRGACIAEDLLPVIIINSNDSQNGRIFSLFHELVHIVLRENGISNFRYKDKDLYDEIEIFCNQTAAEILVPEGLLLESAIVLTHASHDSFWSDDELQKLSNQFCVSREVILRRLLDLGRTTAAHYRQFKNKSEIMTKKTQTGGDYYRNIVARNGNLFLQLALQGYYQEKLTASSLSDYLKIKVSNLSKLEQVLYAKIQH